jgi:outer membrane immunogenic protein
VVGRTGESSKSTSRQSLPIWQNYRSEPPPSPIPPTGDLPPPPPIAPSVAVAPPLSYNWTGCYGGIEGGGNWGESRHISESGSVGLPITNNFDLSGGLFGGAVGCNYQWGAIAFGAEDDMSWTNKTGSTLDIPPFVTTTTSRTSEQWLDTLRGRIGFAWDRVLLYGTGGAAWAGTSVTVSNPTVPFVVNDGQTRAGWVAGAGVEWAALVFGSGSLNLKFEYLHADFGSSTYVNPPVVVPNGTVNSRSVSLTDDIFRAGVNWKFNM